MNLPVSRIFVLSLLLASTAYPADPAGNIHSGDSTLERTRLYTKSDPASPGGIKGHISAPEQPIEQVLAMPTDNPEALYSGEITGPKHDSFQFAGIPVGKYDLVVIYDSAFYEGFQLSRDPSTLNPEDLKKIDECIQKSEPYFPKKFIHRVEGVTGRGSTARCLCTYFRDMGSNLDLTTFGGKSFRPDFRRTYKLAIIKDVGPGWQIVRARDLYPVWTDPKHALPSHHYCDSLSQIRVADQVKNLGSIDLSH